MVIKGPATESPAELETTRLALVEEIRARLDVLEARYELPSKRLDDSLRDGTIRETAEISEWRVIWETYLVAVHEGSTRPE